MSEPGYVHEVLVDVVRLRTTRQFARRRGLLSGACAAYHPNCLACAG